MKLRVVDDTSLWYLTYVATARSTGARRAPKLALRTTNPSKRPYWRFKLYIYDITSLGRDLPHCF